MLSPASLFLEVQIELAAPFIISTREISKLRIFISKSVGTFTRPLTFPDRILAASCLNSGEEATMNASSAVSIARSTAADEPFFNAVTTSSIVKGTESSLFSEAKVCASSVSTSAMTGASEAAASGPENTEEIDAVFIIDRACLKFSISSILPWVSLVSKTFFGFQFSSLACGDDGSM